MKLTVLTDARLRREYEVRTGMQIAVRYGVPYSKVYNRLRRLGVQMQRGKRPDLRPIKVGDVPARQPKPRGTRYTVKCPGVRSVDQIVAVFEYQPDTHEISMRSITFSGRAVLRSDVLRCGISKLYLRAERMMRPRPAIPAVLREHQIARTRNGVKTFCCCDDCIVAMRTLSRPVRRLMRDPRTRASLLLRTAV